MTDIDATPRPDSSLSARLFETVSAVRARTELAPRIGIVLGSGLGSFGSTLEDVVVIPYRELPHMPATHVPGHAGNLCLGHSNGVPVVCMQGRAHFYEGNPVAAEVHGVRTMAELGVESVLLTNAAGGLEPAWSAGDFMLVTDHINLTGINPLLGPNDDDVGPRFVDMTCAYDREIQECARQAAREHGIVLREGVYVGNLGPSYETPAEVRMLRILGGHAVGLSTVHETLALRHRGVRVGALSCISNLAAGLTSESLSHSDVERIAKSRQSDLNRLVGSWIRNLARPA